MSKRAIDIFESLIAPVLERLFSVAYRLTGHAPDAEDLVQDVCVLACEHVEALRGADHPERWLIRVLYNRFIAPTCGRRSIGRVTTMRRRGFGARPSSR